MKLPAISIVVCVLFILHAACSVESRRSFRSWEYTSIFAFGDSFADVGNTPGKSHGPVSRAWYYPYGESVTTGRAKATGRFSDDKVQSDFLAKTILGLHEAPPAYNRVGFHLYLNGVTFATGGAGVFQVPAANVTTIGQQVDSFERLLKKGTISRSRLRYSVFLVAVSGNDYEPAISNEMLAAKVTDEIVAIVNRLRKLGAKKILVNNMHPLGCAPRRARYGNTGNYTGCDQHGNAIASVHNNLLEQKLANTNDTVLVLDINTAFTKIINGSYGSDQFTNRLRPCCEATDPKGYCGRGDNAGVLEFNFKLDMDHVNSYFYWDEMNPTNAGWKAVMKQLERTIKDFLSTDH
uniref:Uncharacterized protein n=1 Tax=Avena sativa TaxID=4498 RepID=A0ACD6AE02_AVESA